MLSLGLRSHPIEPLSLGYLKRYPNTAEKSSLSIFQKCLKSAEDLLSRGFWNILLNTPERADPENPLDFLVHVKKVALPLLPQLGLEPNIYYIPPVHVGNINFLRMLFGPSVDQAVQTYRKAMGGRDIELVAALLLNVSTDSIMTKFKVIGNAEVAGYDENGHEVVRLPLKEPIVVRPFFDEKLQTYRHNITWGVYSEYKKKGHAPAGVRNSKDRK